MKMTATETAIKNQLHSGVYTATSSPCRFNKMNPDKGVGRILLVIRDNPGLTHEQILAFLPGTAKQSETFTRLNNAKVIENIRGKGYFITKLGEDVIREAGL